MVCIEVQTFQNVHFEQFIDIKEHNTVVKWYSKGVGKETSEFIEN